MSGIVLDASAAVKLVLDEEHREHAQALYERTVRAGEPVQAPLLLPPEALNAVYQNLRRGALTQAEAAQAVERFLAIPIALTSPDQLYPTALGLATTYHLPSFYDATYVALAELLACELWTADQRLLNTLGGRLPRVRWLGDFPLSRP